MVKGIEEAVAALKREPDEPVTAEIDGLLIELRYKGESAPAEPVAPERPPETLADLFRRLGPWEGETYEEITQLLRESRKQGGSTEPPVF